MLPASDWLFALDTKHNGGQLKDMTDVISNGAAKAFISALPDAALLVDREHLIVEANQAACDILSARLEGQPVGLFLRSPEVLRALTDSFSSVDHRHVELVLRAKVQRTLDVHFSHLGQGERSGLVLVILHDRTREQQVERMRSDFVANASHELRTPLTTLSGFIETMQGAASKDEKARAEFLKLMKTQAERMSSLIDDLLSLSRIELDEHVVPSSIVDLKDVVLQTQNLLLSLVRESGCTLEIKLPAKMVVRGDANQLAQVVHNLIENAIKYSGSGKMVSVTGNVTASSVDLSIADNGPGIAAHHIPRLTERFYRVNVQDSRMRGGTGLGLAICKHIINRHRGRLVIESEVGVGSIFRIEFPKPL
jgi:two-component system, OmpR family, phosphate regulon sensor histidine kinase PhoR